MMDKPKLKATVPIIVNDKNNPRLRAYKDSLVDYNKSTAVINKERDAYKKLGILNESVENFNNKKYIKLTNTSGGGYDPKGEYETFITVDKKEKRLYKDDVRKFIPNYNGSSYSLLIPTKPVQPVEYQEAPIEKIENKISSDDNVGRMRAIKSSPTFTIPHTGYPTIKTRFTKAGKPLYFENGVGDIMPYDDRPEFTKDFAYPLKKK